MDEVLAKAEEWRAAGETVALATVVATRRSAPRPIGSKLAVTSAGRMFGSVSGGCVEADVAERAKTILAGEPSAVVTYGIADDEAWSVGLPCGGEIDVFVEPFTAAPPIERGTSYVVVAGEGLGERWHDDTFERTELREEDARTVFAEAVAPPPRLVAVGAGDIAEALCALARPLGWRTIVVDPRAGLATRERVPSADEIVVAWPDEIEVDADTAVISLVHEERLDIPALRRASRAARSTSAPSAHDAHRRSVASSSASSQTRCTGRSGSISAAKGRQRSRSRSSPRSCRRERRVRRPQAPHPRPHCSPSARPRPPFAGPSDW